MGGGKKLPIYIYRHTKLKSCKGKVVFPSKIERGMIRIGEHCLNFVDRASTPSIWNVEDGEVVFKGSCFLNQGTRICVNNGAKLEFGHHFTCTGNSTIICNKGIQIGEYCLFSWDVLLLDSDHHTIIDSNGQAINPPQKIIIGNHVWIGCRNTILKGVRIAENSIIASGSIITKPVEKSGVIVAGAGKFQTILKEEVSFKC